MVAVVYGKEEFQVDVEPEHFVFKDFDSWVRSRFGLLNNPLVYKDSNNSEIILTKSNFERCKTINVELHEKVVKKNEVKPVVNTYGSFAMTFYMAAPVMVALALIGTSTDLIGTYFPVHLFCKYCDDYLIGMHIIHNRGVSLEACIAFICWSTTYLYIRRLWNPETFDGVLPRFSADSFYGGLAAAASVILKSYLLLRISQRS